MKNILIVALLLGSTFTVSAVKEKKWGTPLSRYSKEWDNPMYLKCNTAAKVHYLTVEEKEIIYVLNMVRMNPKLFCQSVIIKERYITSCDTGNYYYKTLITTLMTMKPVGLLTPDSLCHVSALAHVKSTGPTGYVGHDRQTDDARKKRHFSGECCAYGTSGAFSVVLTLLVDKDVESLGHRKICLGSYNRMGPSIGAHTGYGVMAVLDFDY
jgi:uncharacterized protein YkwD